MIEDIFGHIKLYADEHNYWLLLDYDAGANQQLDKFVLQQEKQVAIYVNIVENGTMTPSVNDRRTTLTRTIDVTMFTQSPTFNDEGINYYPIINDLIERQLDLFKELIQNNIDIQTASYQSGIDQADATLVMCRMTYSIADTVTFCERYLYPLSGEVSGGTM